MLRPVSALPTAALLALLAVPAGAQQRWCVVNPRWRQLPVHKTAIDCSGGSIGLEYCEKARARIDEYLIARKDGVYAGSCFPDPPGSVHASQLCSPAKAPLAPPAPQAAAATGALKGAKLGVAAFRFAWRAPLAVATWPVLPKIGADTYYQDAYLANPPGAPERLLGHGLDLGEEVLAGAAASKLYASVGAADGVDDPAFDAVLTGRFLRDEDSPHVSAWKLELAVWRGGKELLRETLAPLRGEHLGCKHSAKPADQYRASGETLGDETAPSPDAWLRELGARAGPLVAKALEGAR